ncbi:hypothetical protein EGW08_018857, partial [Elysia chlorotica]
KKDRRAGSGIKLPARLSKLQRFCRPHDHTTARTWKKQSSPQKWSHHPHAYPYGYKMYPKHALSLLWVLGLHMALIPRGFSPYAAAVSVFTGASYSEPEAEARDVARPSDLQENTPRLVRQSSGQVNDGFNSLYGNIVTEREIREPRLRFAKKEPRLRFVKKDGYGDSMIMDRENRAPRLRFVKREPRLHFVKKGVDDYDVDFLMERENRAPRLRFVKREPRLRFVKREPRLRFVKRDSDDFEDALLMEREDRDPSLRLVKREDLFSFQKREADPDGSSDLAETSEQTEREVYEMLETEDNSGHSELNSRKRRSVELLHMGSDSKRSTNSDVPGVVLGRNKRSLPTATEGLGLEERGKRDHLSINNGMKAIAQLVESERQRKELIQHYRDLVKLLNNAGKKRSLLISTDDMNKRDDLTSSVTSKMEAIGAMVKRKRED